MSTILKMELNFKFIGNAKLRRGRCVSCLISILFSWQCFEPTWLNTSYTALCFEIIDFFPLLFPIFPANVYNSALPSRLFYWSNQRRRLTAAVSVCTQRSLKDQWALFQSKRIIISVVINFPSCCAVSHGISSLPSSISFSYFPPLSIFYLER